MQAYLRVRQLSTESLQTYGERCHTAIHDVQDAFTECNQPTDWEALWRALTTGLMFMNARQDFRDVAMVHVVGWDKTKWTLDNLIALTNNRQDLQRGAGGRHNDSIAMLTSNMGVNPDQLTEQVALLLQQRSAAGAPPHQLQIDNAPDSAALATLCAGALPSGCRQMKNGRHCNGPHWSKDCDQLCDQHSYHHGLHRQWPHRQAAHVELCTQVPRPTPPSGCAPCTHTVAVCAEPTDCCMAPSRSHAGNVGASQLARPNGSLHQRIR